ncbi:MAG: CsbD family protein [Mycobacterium sp.]
MSEHDKAGQAREGLMSSVKGKAKEIAGAVIGNDSLTAEGQLEQAQARERKEANIAEVVADAEVDEARTELSEAEAELARERIEVDTEAAQAKGAIQAQKQDEKRMAEQAGRNVVAREAVAAQAEAQHEAHQAKTRERAEVEATQEEFVEAAAEYKTAVKVTDNAKQEAERLRRRADEISKEADLP